MNFRFTVILFLVLLLLIGGLLVAVLIDDGPATDAVLLAPLAGQKADEIEVVEIVRGDPEEKLVFAKVGKDKWELREGQSGRADASAIVRLVEALLRLKPTTTPDLTGNPATHGLDKPVKVTLRGKGQKSATLLVGDSTIGKDNAVTFVADGEKPGTPLAVKRADLAPLFKDGSKDGKAAELAKWVSDYRLKRLLGVDIMDPVTQAKSLAIRAGDKELAMSRLTGSEWKFDKPAGYGLVDIAGAPEAQTDLITGLRALMATLSGFSATAAEDFVENPIPLEKFGLTAANPNLIRIELTPAEGPADVLFIGSAVPDAKPSKYYAMVQGERCVAKIFGNGLEALVKTVADPKALQDRTLVKELDAPRIDALDIAAGGTTAKLRKVLVANLPRWVLYGGPNDPQFAGNAVMTLVAELTKPRVASEALAAPADAMFAPPNNYGEIRLWVDGYKENPETKKEGFPAEPKVNEKPTMTIFFGKVEGDIAFVRRILADGTKTDFKVPALLATLAAKKRVDYLDLKFPEFATSLVKKLTFNHGAEVFELDRGDKAEVDFTSGKWTFAKPESLKGQIADAELVGGSQAIGAGLLGTLATLSATSVVSETPTEAELKTWGLDPAAPRMKVTLTSPEDKEKERVFYFGTETADKAYVHFRLQGKPTVYLVPRVSIDNFFNLDLRDKTPYRFDSKDVKSITLRGWQKKLGKLTDLTLERSGENWAVKGDAKITVNPQAVGLLLNHFRAPKPAAVLGKDQKPEHGFAANLKDADPLEVTFHGEKGPIAQINLGNETDGGSNFFAWNSATKDVQTWPTGLFRQFKDGGPDYFKK